MEIKTGRIDDVVPPHGFNKDGTTPSKRYVFTIEGKIYSTFDKKIGDEFKVGQYIEMEGNLEKGYWNMKTMKEIGVNDMVETPVKVKEKDVKSTPRTSADITATELIRYAVKLKETMPNSAFDVVCAEVLTEFNKFKEKLNG